MTRAAAALRALLFDVASGLGMEGAFLVFGTALIAIGASYLSPAGPWIVTGTVSLVLAVALAVPPRKP